MCINPLRCSPNPDGGRPIFHKDGEQEVGCGKCHECISLNASDWSIRVQHELGEHSENCCVTLTYDSAKLPSLDERKENFQLFMKRLRRSTKKKISYLVSHEFGSDKKRLHHHAILFGVSFPDMKFFKKTPKGTDLFTSRLLDKTWQNGWANIGEASVRAGYYIASYALKKNVVDFVNSDGEILQLKDCIDSSKRPAIGLRYLLRNYRDMILRGDRMPRYYLKKMGEYGKLEKEKPFELMQMMNSNPEKFNLLKDMYDWLSYYEGNLEFKTKTPHQQIAKHELYRQKLSQDGGFRKNKFTKEDHFRYLYHKQDMLNSINLSLETNK